MSQHQKSSRRVKGMKLSGNFLPDDCILAIFAFLDAEHVAKLCLVSQRWRRLASTPSLWAGFCGLVWWSFSFFALRKFVGRRFNGSWRDLYLNQPHIRFDGVYLLKVTYFTPPAEKGNMPNAISYFRVFRFMPRGRLLYALVNHDPTSAIVWMKKMDFSAEKCTVGQYQLVRGNKIESRVDIGHIILDMKLQFGYSSWPGKNFSLLLPDFGFFRKK